MDTDASDFTIGRILSQMGNDGRIHPILFYSKTMQPAERNYDIYDKELLAIVMCFKEWRHHLEGAVEQIKVLSDYKNLEYFLTTNTLSHRQAQSPEFLASCDFLLHNPLGKTRATPTPQRESLAHKPQ